ncbi:MAG: biotin-dependent carboxyltransferase family protein [Chloroflexi bacterium]|nr:biotin-dependent carboxyltransferase family protein [Chloroflexota bacterium]
MSLHVLLPGLGSTLQDLGRGPLARLGVPESGPADAFAQRAANALVGNPPDACAIEVVGLPFTVRADDARIVAVTGPDVWAVGLRRLPGWTALFLRAGEELTVRGSERTRYAYLAVSGGIDVPPVLGSRATHLLSALGPLPRALVAGDELPLAPARDAKPGARIDAPEHDGTVALLPGAHRERFSAAAVRAMTEGEFRVLPDSDRMGVRLDGPPLEGPKDEILTCGLVAGAIQVPRGGAPIVALADRGTTGGYPVIATVIGAHLGRVAQAAPGEPLRFYWVERERALDELRAARRGLALLSD